MRRCLIAHCVDGLVHAVAPAHLSYLRYRVAVVEVDGYCSNLACLVQALLHMVDGIDRCRATDDTAISRHQSDGAAAEDGDALAGADLSKFCAVIAGGEYVCEHREVGLEPVAGRKGQAVEVGVGHLQVFGLTTAPGSHCHISIRATREAGVDDGAEAGETPLAVLAEAARHIEGHYHPVAGVQRLYCRADFLDDAHVLTGQI